MPALFGNERRFVFTHRASVSGERNWVKPAAVEARFRQTAAFAGRGRCAMQYSSPSRATRNSRLGSLNSVAPQVAQRWSGSFVTARLNLETLAPDGHLLALPEMANHSGPKKMR